MHFLSLQLCSNVELFNYDGTQYRYQNGTSFSAPLVSGVAALLMSQRPELSHRKIKQLILDAASKTAALSGKVLTGGMLDANGALLSAKSATPPLPQTNLFSSVLPASRSVPVGGTATAFATIINAGATMAEGCTLAPARGLPGHFTFQTTNSATNAVTGTPNTPVNVPVGGIQSFVIAFRPYAAFNPAEFQLAHHYGKRAETTVERDHLVHRLPERPHGGLPRGDKPQRVRGRIQPLHERQCGVRRVVLVERLERAQ